jgi:3-methyladenine DNA glycosylase AlkC
MASLSKNISVADYYFSVLENLNSNSKLDLISKLSQSLKETDKTQETSLQSLFGAYKSDETAEAIIAELRASRVFNRNIEML